MDIWEVNYAQMQKYEKFKCLFKKYLLCNKHYTVKLMRKFKKTTMGTLLQCRKGAESWKNLQIEMYPIQTSGVIFKLHLLFVSTNA